MDKKGRLIIAANRSPFDFDSGKVKNGAGGLVTAMKSILGDSGLWIGLSRGNDDFAETDENHRVSHGGITMRKVFIPEDEYEPYYNEFANSFLWPLMHLNKRRLDLESETFPSPQYSEAGFSHYLLVNKIFATAVMGELHKNDDDTIIWIHDYHFMFLSEELRQWTTSSKKAVKIGQFWHIPWVNPNFLNELLPRGERTRVAFKQLCSSLLANDLLGFQTPEYTENFVNTLRELDLSVSISANNDSTYCITGKWGTTTVGAFPIGVNIKEIESRVNESYDHYSGTRLSNHHPQLKYRYHQAEMFMSGHKSRGRNVLVGLERLDYTKGILERLDILDTLLSLGQKIAYIGFAQPSRADIKAYDELRRVIIQRTRDINKKHEKRCGYTPIFIETECGIETPWNYFLLKDSDACLVTTLADGMNLVVLESIIAKTIRPKYKSGIVIMGDCGASNTLRDFSSDDGLIRLQDPLNTSQSSAQIAFALDNHNSVSNELAQFARKTFSIDTWGKNFLNCLNRA